MTGKLTAAKRGPRGGSGGARTCSGWDTHTRSPTRKECASKLALMAGGRGQRDGATSRRVMGPECFPGDAA